MSPTAREDCAARDEGKCFRCGEHVTDGWPGYSVHHRLLRSGGGQDELDNLILLCGSGTTGCHGWVHEHVALAKRSGWICSRYGEQPPAQLPVRHWQYGWVFLTHDGLMRQWGETEDEVIPYDC